MLQRLSLSGMIAFALLVAGAPAPAAAYAAVPDTVGRRVTLPAPRAAGRPAAPTEAPIAFSMVGFEVPVGAELEFRTSADGDQWSPWAEVEVVADESPDRGSAEARAARTRRSTPARRSIPVWVGAARFVQTRQTGMGRAPRRGLSARATTSTAAPTAQPAAPVAHLIDSAGLNRSWADRVGDRLRAALRPVPVPPPAVAALRKPAIVTRRQWGADESLRRGSPSYASRVRMGVVHHTAGSNSYTRAEAPAVVRAIYRYHTASQGWSDIGYNYLVDRYGTIYEGRYGGTERAVIGAHAGGFNTETFGVSLLGEFSSTPPTAAARASLTRLLAWRFSVAGVDAGGTVRYVSHGSTRYQSGTAVRLPALTSHLAVSTTSCPGAALQRLLPDVRDDVRGMQGPLLLTPSASPAAVRVVGGSSVDGPVTFRTGLRPAGGWRMTVRDSAGTVVVSAKGRGRQAEVTWVPASAAVGRYVYRFTSAGRQAVSGTVDLVAPTLTLTAAPRQTVVTGARPRAPVMLAGSAYPGARWTLRVFDPSGVRVFRTRGTGPTVTAAWNPSEAELGTHRWTLSAPGAVAVGGTIRVLADRLVRVPTRSNPVAAAVDISRATFADGRARRAVVVPVDSPAAALIAGPLAGRLGPILTIGAGPDSRVTRELRRVLPRGAPLYVVSVGAAPPATVDARLDDLWSVRRLGGASTRAAAAAVADEVLGQVRHRRVLIVAPDRHTGWQPVLAAGAYGAASRTPVLLTGRQRLSPRAQRVVESWEVSRSLVLGPRRVVPDEVAARLPGVRRIGAGDDPPGSATDGALIAAETARVLWRRRSAGDGQRFVLVNATDPEGWVRGLVAAPLAARGNAPLLFAGARTVPPATSRYLRSLRYRRGTLGGGWVLGGTDSVGRAVSDSLSGLLQ